MPQGQAIQFLFRQGAVGGSSLRKQKSHRVDIIAGHGPGQRLVRTGIVEIRAAREQQTRLIDRALPILILVENGFQWRAKPLALVGIDAESPAVHIGSGAQ